MKESEVAPQVKQILEASGCVIFRNNIGCMKIGKRFVRYGVGGNGGADLIGFTPTRITPEMVGKTIAVFTAVETKRDVGGRATEEQINFIKNAQAFGAIAGFARGWEDALDIVKSWRSKISLAPASKP